ncbi:hypothetical protein [Pseudofrankia saprophytica]|uniref:hypothetical protein n=1 Tax=Pseudofrankia saprophytica TaxID=298655 RepID=UPI000234D3EA|nr:hypothetical protein [Pseudofrankia saprophytica]
MSETLPAPDPHVASTDRGVLVTWEPITGASTYMIMIMAPDGKPSLGSIPSTSFPFSIDPAREPVGTYWIKVRAGHLVSFSDWSAPVTFELWPTTAPLVALHDRLIAGRTSPGGTTSAHRYALDAAAFPAGPPARADAVATGLTDAFRQVVVVDSATGPELSGDGRALTLRGTLAPPSPGAVAPFGPPAPACVLTATVTPDGALRGRLAVSLPAGWTWGTAFGLLAGSAADGVVFQTATLTMSTGPGAATDLQFEGVTSVRTRLGVPADPARPAMRQTVMLRGAVRLDAYGRPAFALASINTLDLVIGRAGQDPLTLTAATVTLRADPPGETAGPDAPIPSALVARGVLAGLGAAPLPAEAELPHAWSGTATVRVGPDAQLGAFASVGAALAVAGTPAPVLTALRTLPALGPAAISGLTVTADASGLGPTRTELSVAVTTTPWRIVSAPELAVTGTVLTLAVTRRPRPAHAPGQLTTTFTAAATGTVTLAGAAYPVRVDLGARAPATVTFSEPGRLPALATATAAAGFTDGEARAALPAALVTQGPVTLDRVVLDVDLTAQTVTGVLPRFRQSQPWRMSGGRHLELSDWTVDLSMQRGGGRWSPYGTITGTISLGSHARPTARFRVQAWIPADAQTGHWTFALARDETMRAASFNDLTALVDGHAGGLPAGLPGLRDLDITALAATYDPGTRRMMALTVAVEQSSPWTIIQRQLAVSDLELLLTLRRTGRGTSLAASGTLFGTVTVGGQPVDAGMIKSDPEGGWELRIAWAKPVACAGLADLDDWLVPNALRRYLPASLPLASGFELRNVVARFHPNGGHLAGFGAHLIIPDLWTVIPDRLSITDVRAEIDADIPVMNNRIRGSVLGTVTVGGAAIQVRATKPRGTAPWEFAGSLLDPVAIDLIGADDDPPAEPVGIDLVAAANGLSGQVFTLPAGSGTPGALPARITIETADVLAVPDTGRFHLAGKASFEWHPRLGAATLAIEEITGTVDVARTGAAVEVTVAGALTFAGLRATVGLRLGTAGTRTILTGTVAPADAEHISLPDLTDGVTGAAPGRRWADVLPADLRTPAFSSAALWADLTGGELVLHGRLAGLGDGVLLTSDTAFALAVALADGFQLSRLLPALHVDDVLTVRAARLVVVSLPAGDTLGAVAERVGTALAAAAPGVPSPVADLAGSSLGLTDGALFAAELDVHNAAPGTLLRAIMEIGAGDGAQPGSPPSVRVFAQIDRTDAARTVFTAELDDIALFGGLVTITHRVGRTMIQLAYRPASAHEFTLDARVLLTLSGRSYGFDVSLRCDDDHLATVADAVRPTTQSVAPFDLPGIQIDELALAARIDYAKPAVAAGDGTPAVPARPRSTRFSLTGRARLGPAPAAGEADLRLSLGAELVVLDAAPALARLTVERPFSLAAFLERCVTGGGGSWGSFVDVTLLAGSRIYYYSAAADPAGTLARAEHLLPGYHLDARVTIRLVVDVTVNVSITVVADRQTGAPAGVTAAIALADPVDLRFAQLAGTRRAGGGHVYTGGPEVRFTTGTQASFAVAAGVNFLGAAFGSVQVAVSQDVEGTRRFAGRLESAQRHPMFGRLSCGFTYAVRPDGGDSFEIADWPAFTWARELVDLVAAIREVFDAARIDGCGALADFAVARTFRSSWSLTPAVRSDGPDLVFALTGTYKLTLPHQGEAFLTVSLPPFEVRIPSTTRFDDLPDALAAGVARGAHDIATALLRDPEKIAIFAGVVFGPQAAAYAEALLCKDLVATGTVAAAEAAAAALAGAIAKHLGVAAGTVAATAAAAASLRGSTGGGGGQGEGGQGGGQGGETPTPTPAKPTDVTLEYADGRFSLRWSPARYAGGYEAELGTDAASSALASVTLGLADRPLQLTHTVSVENLPAGRYVGRVQAYRAGLRGEWAESRPLTRLASPPATIVLQVDSFVVTWEGPPGTAYDVLVTDPDGRTVGTATTYTKEGSGNGASGVGVKYFTLDDPRDGVYSARVRTVGGDIEAAWGTAGTVAVRTLATPTGLTVDVGAGVLTVAFAAVPTATLYVAEVTAADGTAADAPIRASAVAGPSPRCTVPVRAPDRQPYRPGTTYAVRVQAQRPDLRSAWSTPMTVAYTRGTRP